MKAHASVLLFCCAAFLVGCSSVDVRTGYDRDVNFASYRSFDWMERHNPRDGGPRGTGFNDPLAQRHIQQAIERELVAKGVKKIENNPDLLVAFHATSRNAVDVERYGYRYGRWGRVRGTVTTVERYKEGSVVEDLIDAKSKDLVWRGVAQDALRKGENRMEYFDEMMKQLFKEYPPKQ